jgi:hypothetical protein
LSLQITLTTRQAQCRILRSTAHLVQASGWHRGMFGGAFRGSNRHPLSEVAYHSCMLDSVKVGDCLLIASTMKGSSVILQQVTSTTTGLVRTLNYTFRRDGRSFSMKQRSLTARPATASEIEAWLSGRRKQEPQTRTEPTEEVVLARYLASVSAEEWARLGTAWKPTA